MKGSTKKVKESIGFIERSLSNKKRSYREEEWGGNGGLMKSESTDNGLGFGEGRSSGVKLVTRDRDEMLNETPGFYASRNSGGVFSLNSSSYTKIPPALQAGEDLGLFNHKLSLGDRGDRKYTMIRRKGE